MKMRNWKGMNVREQKSPGCLESREAKGPNESVRVCGGLSNLVPT